MKFIRVGDKLISLENVIDVETVINEHTFGASGYLLYNCRITVRYSSNQTSDILLENQTSAERVDEIFEEICEKLSE